MRASWGSCLRALSAARTSVVRSSEDPALDMGWPLPAGRRTIRPRSQAATASRGSHSCAATGPGLGGPAHFPHTGHPWPARSGLTWAIAVENRSTTEVVCHGLTFWEFRPLVQTNATITWNLLQTPAKRLRTAPDL